LCFIPHPSSNLSTGNKLVEVRKIISLYKGSVVTAADTVEDNHGVMSVTNQSGDVYKIIDLVKEEGRSVKIEYLRDHGDVVVGINVPKEGFDWPAASREIIVGPRGSLTDLIQMLGRTFRAHPAKGYGLEPVEIYHVMPWVDRAAVDDDELRDKFNTYMSAVMMSLIFEDIMLPVDLKVPSLRKNDNDSIPEPNEVMEYIKDVLGDEGWIKLRSEAMDACTEYRSQNEDVTVREANEMYQQIIMDMVNDCADIEEYEEDIADLVFKSFMRASFKAARLDMVSENVDELFLDMDLMDQVDAVAGFTTFFLKEYCDALTLKEYRQIAYGRFIASAEQHREWIRTGNYTARQWVEEGYPKYKDQGAVYSPDKKFKKPWSWFTGNTKDNEE